MVRYRYILCGVVEPDSKLSSYRLIGGNNFSKSCTSCIRVELPENINLEKYSCDSYSTTDDSSIIKNLNPVVMVKYNGTWKIDKILTKKWLDEEIQPHEFYKSIDGYHNASNKFGFVTAKQYRWYLDNIKNAWKIDKLPKCNGDEINFIFPNTIPEHMDDISCIRDFLENKSIDTKKVSDEELEWRWYSITENINRCWVKPCDDYLNYFLMEYISKYKIFDNMDL